MNFVSPRFASRFSETIGKTLNLDFANSRFDQGRFPSSGNLRTKVL